MPPEKRIKAIRLIYLGEETVYAGSSILVIQVSEGFL